VTNHNHISALEKIIGKENILTDPHDTAPYEKGWRDDGGKAAFVLRPHNTNDVSRILSYCAKNNIHIIPQGANTGLVSGSTPDTSGAHCVLSLSRLNTIFHIDPINRTAHVGAGCKLSALNATLEEHGLYFPIDLGADPTIGGMLATNTGGGRFLKYGGVRENTLGLRAILSDEDGTLIDLLHPCRKNNTGPDLKHLFIGTSGAFGIITEALVNLAPLPQQTATALLIPRTPESVNTLLMEMERRCGNYFSAFEGMSGEAIKRALAHSPTLTNPFGRDAIPNYAILLELTRTWTPRVGEQPLTDILESILSELWAMPEEPLENALLGDPAKLWALRHALSEGVQKSGKLIAFDIAFKRGDVMNFLMQMHKQLPAQFPDIAICDFGHIGDGGVHFNLVVAKDDPRLSDNSFETNLRRWVYDCVVREYNGSFSAEHALGRKNQMFYDLYTPQNIKNINHKIKNLLCTGEISAILL
jgi:FAD/FMN-containing dehydrogenase